MGKGCLSKPSHDNPNYEKIVEPKFEYRWRIIDEAGMFPTEVYRSEQWEESHELAFVRGNEFLDIQANLTPQARKMMKVVVDIQERQLPVCV